MDTIPPYINKHHREAIQNLVTAYKNDPQFLAIIIGGSVAKNCARHDSDVDFMIVAKDEAYQERFKKGDLFINRTDLCNYQGGFVDGKIIDMAYLTKVAKKGNEPSRAAFDGAFLAYSHLKDMDQVLKQIHVYPEKERETRMRSFYAMAFIQNWLMGEADRHGNIYTASRAASQLAFYAGRLILAYNRILFPYHKWFLHYLRRCELKPDNFMENIDALLKSPNLEHSKVLFQNLKQFNDWGVSDHEAYMWFMTEVEWSWMNGSPPLEDL